MSRPQILVSMAVISPRLPALDFVLASLLEQTLAPAKVVLAISPEPFLLDGGVRPDDLPPYARRMVAAGRVSLVVTPNIGSYRKLLPVLERAAGAPVWVATADDDVLYPLRWLEGLYEAASRENAIAAYRTRLASVRDGALTPYESWPLLHRDEARDASGGLAYFPTGRGGVLYRTDFFPDLPLVDRLREIAPAQDDLAFRVATLVTRTRVVPVHPSRGAARHWEFSSAMGPIPGLYDHGNAGGGNDAALAALVKAVRREADVVDLLAGGQAAADAPLNFSLAGLAANFRPDRAA